MTAAATSYESATQTVALSSDLRVDIVLKRVTCVFSVTPATFSFSAEGGKGTVTVASRRPVAHGRQRTSDFFLTIPSGSPGRDNGSVSFSIRPNPVPQLLSFTDTGSARSGVSDDCRNCSHR